MLLGLVSLLRIICPTVLECTVYTYMQYMYILCHLIAIWRSWKVICQSCSTWLDLQRCWGRIVQNEEWTTGGWWWMNGAVHQLNTNHCTHGLVYTGLPSSSVQWEGLGMRVLYTLAHTHTHTHTNATVTYTHITHTPHTHAHSPHKSHTCTHITHTHHTHNSKGWSVGKHLC